MKFYSFRPPVTEESFFREVAPSKVDNWRLWASFGRNNLCDDIVILCLTAQFEPGGPFFAAGSSDEIRIPCDTDSESVWSFDPISIFDLHRAKAGNPGVLSLMKILIQERDRVYPDASQF